ncbi:MAG: flagellar biosynthetic protein FliR [Candidatus Magnetominusculus sp. LBB02]|nr:flagellar biosynthetic protein FliR [Candidatus Magnetominusculus sp. LBB02]
MDELINSGLVSKQIGNFTLILLRVSILMMMLPIFSSKNISPQYKVAFSVALAVLITPLVDFKLDGKEEIIITIVKEIVLAMAIGGAARLAFYAADMAGQLMSNGMSLSIATSFDPEFGQSAEVARFLGILVTLLFFIMDMHHELIAVIVKSFEVLPPGQIGMAPTMIKAIFGGSKVFTLALKLAAPVVVGMVVANLMLGLLYKAAPQINIMFVSFPIFLFVGLILMMFTLPLFFKVIAEQFNGLKDALFNTLLMARP